MLLFLIQFITLCKVGPEHLKVLVNCKLKLCNTVNTIKICCSKWVPLLIIVNKNRIFFVFGTFWRLSSFAIHSNCLVSLHFKAKLQIFGKVLDATVWKAHGIFFIHWIVWEKKIHQQQLLYGFIDVFENNYLSPRELSYTQSNKDCIPIHLIILICSQWLLFICKPKYG